MNTKKCMYITFFFSVFLFLSVSNAISQTYVSVNLSLVLLNDSDAQINDYGETFTFKNGYGVFLVLGNALESGLRSELEVGYRDNGLEKSYGNDENRDISGAFSALSFMANGYYDFKTGSALTPFFGAGIGFARLDVHGEKDDVSAYQGMTGVSYALNTDISLDLQYRYFATSDPTITFNGLKIGMEYSTHNLSLGLRYNF